MTVKTETNALTFATIEPEAGLKAALAMSRPDIIDTVSASGLKGRGGAGFPTGMKWNFCAAEKSDTKYIVCNADEGEPGTFKDRVILSEFADLVLEGMTIGARAIGAKLGVIYLRQEYTYLRTHLNDVIRRRREAGLLGKDILGIDGFEFDVIVALGAGAYVCGEETALIESLEGFRGEPRNRPAVPGRRRPAQPADRRQQRRDAGRRWPASSPRASTGSRASAPTSRPATSCSASRATARSRASTSSPGASPSPTCSTQVGGGDAKAVQIGGASGVCVPASDFARRLAFEDIPTGGSVMVIGPQRDILDVAENFLEFFVEESCGQCTPCRLGNAKLLEGVEAAQEGRVHARVPRRPARRSAPRCRSPRSAASGRRAPAPSCRSSTASPTTSRSRAASA